jgi:Sec-independent protein translocase protein TatA
MIRMSLADAIFILGLALVIFGPKLLSKIDRQTMRLSSLRRLREYGNQPVTRVRRKTNWRQDQLMSKLVIVFRRTSDEFKRRIEDEMRPTVPTILQKQVLKSDGELSDGNRTESHT